MNFDDYFDEYCVPKPVDPDAPTALDKFTSIMQECFDRAPNLQTVILEGTTPSFNDGDPCYHSRAMGYILDGGMLYDEEDGYVIEKYIEDFNADDMDEHDCPWKWDDDNALDSKVSSLIFSQNLDEVIWGTNYSVTISRKVPSSTGGEIKIEKEYCSRGY